MRFPNRFIRTCCIAALSLGAIPLIACSTSAQAQDTGANQSAATTDTSKEHHGFREILSELDLRPEQKAEVDKLLADSKEGHAAVKAAKHELMGALADQIEKGEVDSCALRPDIDKLGAAVAKAAPQHRAMFEKLHAILDPTQRAKLVDLIREKKEAFEKAHEKGELGEAIAKALNLTDDQKTRLGKIFSGLHEIKEAEPAHDAHREQMNKILDAFKGEHFVIDEIAPSHDDDASKHVTTKFKHLLWAGEAVLPVLSQEQRTQVAKFLREKAEHHGHGGEAGE
jgi:Spy/CpxP family protein refolding chaperone